VSYEKRKVLQTIWRQMKKGDTFFARDLTRIDRNPMRALVAIEELHRRGIGVVLLRELGQMEFDTKSPLGAMLLLVSAIVLENQRQWRRCVSIEMAQYRRSRGMRPSGKIPHGKKPVERLIPGMKNKDGTPKIGKYYDWDMRECRHLAELVARIRGGERWRDVAEDFHRRHLKRACGTPWARQNGSYKKRMWSSSLYDAYKRAEEMLTESGSIGGIGIPDAVTLAEWRAIEKGEMLLTPSLEAPSASSSTSEPPPSQLPASPLSP
jgi:hypothetical protein